MSRRPDTRDKSRTQVRGRPGDGGSGDISPPERNLNFFKWRTDHELTGCDRGCVVPKTHFLKWRNVYDRDLDVIYRLVSDRVKENIPYELFVNFAYSHSSGYFPPI